MSPLIYYLRSPIWIIPNPIATLARAAVSFGGVITSMVLFPSAPTGDDTYEALLKKGYLREHFSLNVVNDSAITFEQYRSATLPYLGLFTSSGAAGCINFTADADGPSRTLYPLYRYGDHYYPSLALITALKSRGVDPKEERIIISSDNVLAVGPVRIPLTDDGRMVLNWHGPYRTYDYYPIGDIIESMAAIRRGKAPALRRRPFRTRLSWWGRPRRHCSI